MAHHELCQLQTLRRALSPAKSRSGNWTSALSLRLKVSQPVALATETMPAAEAQSPSCSTRSFIQQSRSIQEPVLQRSVIQANCGISVNFSSVLLLEKKRRRRRRNKKEKRRQEREKNRKNENNKNKKDDNDKYNDDERTFSKVKSR